MRKLTKAEFVSRANMIHGGKYQYPDDYKHSGASINIECPHHGVFVQTPNAHIHQKQGCPQCAIECQVSRRRKPLSTLLQEFKRVHGDFYDYSLVDYTTAHTKVSIICPTHGVFAQSPHSHKKGQGCPRCSRKKQQSYNITRNQHTKDNFVELARQKHGDTFDYSQTKYVHNQQPVTLRCKKHGHVLSQTARHHLDGCNPCPSCNHMKSKGELAVYNYLSIFTDAHHRDRQLLRSKRNARCSPELDIYLPDSQLAVEYCGMYWHSHGTIDDEQQNKHKHYTKHRLCADKGVRLITVYEDEWVNRQFAVKRLLRNAIGKNKGKLMARKCDLEKVSHQDAVSFYERYHPQGGAGAGENYGLYWKGKLVACMRFTKGANDRGNVKNRDWTLTRYATRVTVSGGASRLFKTFVREFSPQKIKSFSDNRYFSGAMYEQLGFQLDQESAPDYAVWHQRLGLLPKSAWQRRSIPARAKELGVDAKFDPETDPRTEREMTYLLGARRIFDCGKKRWVWTLDP